MDSQRPGLVVELQAEPLSMGRRLGRAFGRGFSVMFVALLISNFVLLVIPAPHIHVCSIPISLLLGPIVFFVTWRTQVLFVSTELACSRCAKPITIPEGLGGWPARFNCVHCGIMVELQPALPSVQP